MNDFEIKFVKLVYNFGKGKIDFATLFVSNIGFLAIMWFVIMIAILFYYPIQASEVFGRVFIVTLLHFAISEGFFKYLIPKFFKVRKRPFIAYPDQIKPLGSKFSDGSMPSSHMTSTVAMVLVLSASFSNLIVPGIIFAVFMGFSRIHNGMHYPSDVLIGSILGCVYGAVAIFLI